MQARCRDALLLLCLPLCFLSVGCRNNKSGQLESELRTRDQLYREALEDQRRMEINNLALRQELDALRQAVKTNPEQPAPSTFGVKRIVLGRATGGVDQDGKPGDEALQVVVETRDSTDHAFKVPGTLQIYALEITPEGIKAPLCMWEIPPDKVQASWKDGLLSAGYTMTLPWKTLPMYENVRIVVRFVTLDQRAYEADKDIKVRVLAGVVPRRQELIPPPAGGPAPALEFPPVLVPTGASSASSWRRESTETPAPRTQWQPAAPGVGITVGRPTPIESD